MSRYRVWGLSQLCDAVSSSTKWTTVLGIVLLGIAPLTAQISERPNRISQDHSAEPVVELSGTVHPLTTKATDLGAVNSSLQLNSLTLNIAPSAAQLNEITVLQSALQDPKSPQHHKWLTQSQYGKLFGLTDNDLGQLTSWLSSQGFTVTGVSGSRNAISFSGKAWQVESAFHTQLHHYELDGETHIANALALRIPAQFAEVVLNVRGLDDFRPKANVQRIAASPDTTDSSGFHHLSPADWATIYNANEIYGAGFDGTGIHVGVVGQTYAPQADIDHFRRAAQMSATKLTYHCISTVDCATSAGIHAGDLGEADLDIEWAGGIAKNATVDYIYAAGGDKNLGVFDALQYAIQSYKTANGSALPVVSMSYGTCEAQVDPSWLSLIDTLGQQASLQGQTLVVSSGDSGAAGCDAHGNPSTLTAALGLAVQVPADSPNFTAVGGTTFSGDAFDPTTYWFPQGGLVSSAIQYISETPWNETNMRGLDASGGGESTATKVVTGVTQLLFPKPTWQKDLIAGTAGRLVPDVAFAAAVGHDGYLNCSSDFNSSTYGTMCANGFYSSGGTGGSTFYLEGGTSASAPSFAGMLALLVQRYGPLGNINPVLYPLAVNPTTHAAVFHDITTGNNKFACVAGTTGCVGGLIGYSAATGYDLVTGLGSIDGGALYRALGGASNLAVTTTTVSALPTAVTIGGTTTLSAVIASSPTVTVTGTVLFKVGSTTVGTATISGDTAILSNVMVSTANGFSVGSESITAIYSGDATVGTSSGSTTLTVAPNLAVTTTTVSASPNSLTLGGTTTFSGAIASTTAGTITGTVMFKVGGTTIGTSPVSGGTATLSNFAVSAANGFSVGSDLVTASYSGDANSLASSGSTTLTLAAAAPTYTFTANQTSVTGSSIVALALASTNYTGTVSFVTSVSTMDGTVANVSASAPSATLANGGNGSSALTIAANANAANHAPLIPWQSGGAVVFGAVLLGTPFAVRRKRVLAVMLTALAISLAGLLLACGGGSAGKMKAARIYTVMVTPTGSGTVTNPSPVTITVTVP